MAVLLWLAAALLAQAFYNPSVGKWLSRDPLAEAGGLNLHGFVGNAAISKFDLLGQITVNMVNPPGFEKFDCGGFRIGWGIHLDNNALTDGYIVQHIRLTYNATTCGGSGLSDSVEYWEAIPISAGLALPINGGIIDYDVWRYPPSPNTNGRLQMRGELKFFPTTVTGNLGSFGQNSPSPLSTPPWTAGGSYGGSPQMPDNGMPDNGSPPFPLSSGSYPSTGVQPGFWNQPALEELGGIHLVSRAWRCCCPWSPLGTGEVGQAF